MARCKVEKSVARRVSDGFLESLDAMLKYVKQSETPLHFQNLTKLKNALPRPMKVWSGA